MRRAVLVSLLVVIPAAAVGLAYALDPPHDWTNTINCSNCHTPHKAPGGTITKVAGNPNLCQSCHVAGGLATNKALAETDQAFPPTGLPAGMTASGNSHRWDSGASGHVKADPANTSTGKVQSGGAFTGRYPKTYTIMISGAGEAGIATFSWTDTLGDGASGLVTGTDVPLNEGITVTFSNGTASPSFRLNDRWRVHVRTDINQPTTLELAARIADGKIVCSTCHNQHSQAAEPFDPAAPAYGGSGTGYGRHYQRVANDANQMCKDCHSARDVSHSSQGSHPIGIPLPGTGFFKSPVTLPLDDASRVQCLTCHKPHFGPATDGTLRRLVNITALCTDCHTLADTSTPASHLNPSTGVLWPGGQYGSTFPQVADTTRRGYCTNCHQPHGWPDNASPSQDFPKLWVERYDISPNGTDPDTAENLCYTCHDGSPAQTDIKSQFAKGTNDATVFHHPVKDSEQTPGRSVECVNCHNPHQATSANKLKGVTGIDLAGNPVGPGTANARAAAEYEVCFKCHGDTYNSSRSGTSNKRLDFQTTNSAYHPVAGAGRNQSANLAGQLLGGLAPSSSIRCTDCHNNEATADAQGPASNSAQKPKGPHGSTNGAIRRAAYWTNLTGPTTWNQSNFALCYLCHDRSKHTTARRWGDGASTNFYDDIDGKDNLHWVHLVDRVDKAKAACKNCHYNVHSNVTASNTQYRIDGVLYDTPPSGVHTHLVNFSPDVLPIGGRTKPEWWLNTSSRERRCYLSCHGSTMNGLQYRPARPGYANGGDDNPLLP
jgi:predicted CXXCH cytochrome family protein